MTEKALPLKEFLNQPGIILDVRSPAEFRQGHIPEAFNLSLLSDEERAQVGTAYKHQGKQFAIMLGLKLVGPKLADLVSQARMHAQGQVAKIHCWRGGMRSQFASWLLSFCGIPSVTLHGGYKTYRRWCLEQFNPPYHLIVVGGMTGCGKTETLKCLANLGEQVIDLEQLAKHRGSSFGMINRSSTQPSTEQFENEIAIRLSSLDHERPIWIEDESRLIGTCHLPGELLDQMRGAPLIVINTNSEERIHRLVNEYGKAPIEQLIAATNRISKRLGGQRTKDILTAFNEGLIAEAFTLILQYYDSTYTFSLSKRPFTEIETDGLSIPERAAKLLQIANHFHFSSKAAI